MIRHIDPRLIFLALGAVIVFAVVRSIGVLAIPEGLGLNSRWVWGLVLGGALYLVSHLIRAARISVISMPMLGVSLRTVFSLHFAVAPWSILLPFKLDELPRWNELWRVGRSPIRALLVCAIDRSMDGVILLLLATSIAVMGSQPVYFTILLGLGLSAIGASFFLLPVLLEAVQRHLFLYNFRNDAIRLLAVVDSLRKLLISAREAFSQALPFLIVTTMGIWIMEILAVEAVLYFCFDQPAGLWSAVSVLIERAGGTWQVIWGSGGQGPVSVLTVLFLLVTVLAWVIAVPGYLARCTSEPRRAWIGHSFRQSSAGSEA